MTKTLFLLQIFLASCCSASEGNIPSFESIRNQSSIGHNQEDAAFLAFLAIRNYLCCNEKMPVSSVEVILTQWFHEEPKLFSYAYGIDNLGNGYPGSYTDIFSIMVKAGSNIIKIAKNYPETADIDTTYVFNILPNSSCDLLT